MALLLHQEVRIEVIKFLGAHGRLTEWLGSGLQNRVRRFESATDLNKSLSTKCQGFFVFARGQLAEPSKKNKKDLSCQRQQGFVEGSPKTGSFQ